MRLLSTTFRRAALEALGGYRSVPFPEDYDLFLRLVDAGYGLAKVPVLGLRWRHRARRLTFTDPRCSPDALRLCKATHLAHLLAREPRPLYVWGAGRDGRRFARRLVERDGKLDAAAFRDAIGIGRKRAIQILEFFDRAGHTRRVRDARIVRADSVWP